MRKTKATRREFLRSAAQAGAVLAAADDRSGGRAGQERGRPAQREDPRRGHRHPGPRHARPAVDHGPARRAVRRHLRPAEEAAAGGQELRGRPLRQQGLRDVPGDPRLPGRADGHRRRADRHGRPLARDGVDPGDAGGQGRLHREALLHDHRRGPGGGRDGPPLRPRLPDRHAAAQRGQPRLRHRDGPHRPAGQDPHGLRPHRPLGRGRDAPRLAAGRSPAAQGRGGLGRLAGPLPVAALQPQLRRRRVAGLLRLPHQLHRRMGRAHLRPGPGGHRIAASPRPSSTSTSPTTAATAWSPTSPTA